jgi:phosphocarrier protein FPr
MVGIVVVSHSKELASGIRELVSQMVPDLERIVYTGGTGDPENPVGTDPMQVLSAIQEVISDDGVLVLMDLGSALLSAETALDFLEQEQKSRVQLSSAPLVEGALSAAVQASLGADLATVAREAQNALAMKTSQLGGDTEAMPEKEQPAATGLQLSLTIENANGLHARPAARLVTCLGQFSARTVLEKDRTTVDARSINQIATLGIRKGETIKLWFDGDDAAAACEAVKTLHANHFGDKPATPAQKETSFVPDARCTHGDLTGIPVGGGIAIGPAIAMVPDSIQVEKRTIIDTQAETDRLHAALDSARAACSSLQARTVRQAGDEQAEIFVFHRLLLEDKASVNTAEKIITDEGLCAEYAWKTTTDALARRYEVLEDEYQRARAADIYDIQNAVLMRLCETPTRSLDSLEPGILVAGSLSPSEAANLDKEKITGICLETGTATTHAAIIASSLGIPAVVGVSGILSEVTDGQTLIVDAGVGRIIVDPDSTMLTKYTAERNQWLVERVRQQQAGKRPAMTTDGVRIGITANITGQGDLAQALAAGAEGIGLLRSELLFLNRSGKPGEDEQFEVYRAIASGMKGRQVIIRTLDIGGDKPIPYLYSEPEANPFLGLRGIRFTLAHRDIFLTQLRAILRASADTGIGIMFPMISSAQEFLVASQTLDEAKDQLKTAGIPFNIKLPVGVMIEVPSAVVLADQLARLVDFFSIGTNDLSQYVMAADRGNAQVAKLSDPFHPAVLRMIGQTTAAARQEGIPVAMCGALAGLPEAAPLLVGLGLDELSMNAPLIPTQKATIRKISKVSAGRLAEKALALSSVDEVRALLESYRP